MSEAYSQRRYCRGRTQMNLAQQCTKSRQIRIRPETTKQTEKHNKNHDLKSTQSKPK